MGGCFYAAAARVLTWKFDRGLGQILHDQLHCFVCVTIRRIHRDLTISWCEGSGCFPPEMSAWNPMTRPSPKWSSTTADRSDFTVPSPIPSNMALQLHINISFNRPPDRTWRRPPGRPRNKWLNQLRNDSTCPIELSMQVDADSRGTIPKSTKRRPRPMQISL